MQQTEKLYAVCTVSTSCEQDLSNENKDALDDVDDAFDDTNDKIDDVADKYDELNKELDKNIKDLEIILRAEKKTTYYLYEILNNVKAHNSIKHITKDDDE